MDTDDTMDRAALPYRPSRKEEAMHYAGLRLQEGLHHIHTTGRIGISRQILLYGVYDHTDSPTQTWKALELDLVGDGHDVERIDIQVLSTRPEWVLAVIHFEIPASPEGPMAQGVLVDLTSPDGSVERFLRYYVQGKLHCPDEVPGYFPAYRRPWPVAESPAPHATLAEAVDASLPILEFVQNKWIKEGLLPPYLSVAIGAMDRLRWLGPGVQPAADPDLETLAVTLPERHSELDRQRMQAAGADFVLILSEGSMSGHTDQTARAMRLSALAQGVCDEDNRCILAIYQTPDGLTHQILAFRTQQGADPVWMSVAVPAKPMEVLGRAASIISMSKAEREQAEQDSTLSIPDA